VKKAKDKLIEKGKEQVRKKVLKKFKDLTGVDVGDHGLKYKKGPVTVGFENKEKGLEYQAKVEAHQEVEEGPLKAEGEEEATGTVTVQPNPDDKTIGTVEAELKVKFKISLFGREIVVYEKQLSTGEHTLEFSVSPVLRDYDKRLEDASKEDQPVQGTDGFSTGQE
jgi:hypothetical protein